MPDVVSKFDANGHEYRVVLQDNGLFDILCDGVVVKEGCDQLAALLYLTNTIPNVMQIFQK